MALIHRLSRLLTADIHAVLDRIEDPNVLLQHAIREMEEDLAQVEQRERVIEHEREANAERRRKIRATLTELGAQLDVCFAERNEELSRKVIKRRLETERLEQHIAERSAALDTELAVLRRALDERRETLDAMRQKAELLVRAPAGDDTAAARAAVSDDEVEVALLRERQRRQPS